MNSEPTTGYELSSDNSRRSQKLLRKFRGGRKGLDNDPYRNELHDEEEEEVYVVKQHWGYCSIIFSLAQTVILIIMILKCGIAPIKINPMIGPYPDVLSDWGGKNAIDILDDGEWWRLITPILLHAGIIHLLCNVAVQLETGAFFEREWGSGKWLAIYLVSAVGSSILSVIAMPNSISVGSSGAVMGLFGGKLSEVLFRCFETRRTPQDHVGHTVRKEQLMACLCSVLIVGLFSFIPYGACLLDTVKMCARMSSLLIACHLVVAT
jgi:membrane associated rhomboid family serine protease